MVGHTEKQTRDEAARMTAMSYQGCIPCMIDRWNDVPATVQHVTDGGRRLGHRDTYKSCPWHHLGQVDEAFYGSVKRMTEVRGPSFAHDKPAFEARYGSELELVQIQDALVREYWRAWHRGEFIPPAQMGRLAVLLHAEIVLKRPPRPVDIELLERRR